MTETALVLTASEVGRLLAVRDCIDAVTQAFREHERGTSRGPVSGGLTLAEGTVHTKMAAVEDDGRTFVVAKTNVNLPGNPERHGRPTIQGVLVLLDGRDGRPLAVMDSIALTGIRTAAVSALAADLLAVPDARTITIVGCGAQGDAALRAMAVVRDLREAFVVDTDAGRAGAFASRMSEAMGFPVTALGDVTMALERSQICVTCTTSKVPIVFPGDLRPGHFIAAVGADNPAKQEIHADALAQSVVVVDSLPACASSGDLHHALHAGVMTEQDVHAELSAVVAGLRPGRTGREQVIVFDSTGTALQDAAAAALVYRRARSSGLGASVMFDDRAVAR